MEPITIMMIVGAKVALQTLGKTLSSKAGEYAEAEAKRLGCSVEELPKVKEALKRAQELGCSLEDLPKAEEEFRQRQSALALEAQLRAIEDQKRKRLEEAWYEKQEREKRLWIEEQMKK